MSKFKVGDKVRRIAGAALSCPIGSVQTVEGFDYDGDLILKGLGDLGYCARYFSPLYPNPPHKHAELIKAWADGAEIEEYWETDDDWGWERNLFPDWYESTSYRIKPNEPTPKEKAQAKLEELMKQAEELKCQIDNM